MRTVNDKFYDLAIVDPPYGIGEHGGKLRTNKKRPCYELRKTVPKYENKGWDNKRPTAEYWKELERISKHRIIFGANYFTQYLPPSMGWIFWDKRFEGTVFSDGEFIYTSFQRGAKKVTLSSKSGTRGGLDRIHPTQKPTALYYWILEHYAKREWKIIDTHLGSASSAIASFEFGINEFVGCEIDTGYYEKAVERYNDETKQQTLCAAG